jgi:HTH-type transcriptional regulator/antitoxin HigA
MKKMKKRLAQKWQPGPYIADELEVRGWTAADISHETGLTVRQVQNLISGKKKITPRIAAVFSDLFGTSAEIWMNLQREYDNYRGRR